MKRQDGWHQHVAPVMGSPTGSATPPVYRFREPEINASSRENRRTKPTRITAWLAYRVLSLFNGTLPGHGRTVHTPRASVSTPPPAVNASATHRLSMAVVVHAQQERSITAAPRTTTHLSIQQRTTTAHAPTTTLLRRTHAITRQPCAASTRQ